MPSIFLSHSSVDKPFVEKLAKDLTHMGVDAWFDKWEIKVGESITWKIEDGIRENEYFGIVLSPEALQSEWVKSEISAGWIKQMQTKKILVLPIYYRQCSIPYFLADRNFADFRQDYQKGLEQLASVFNISNIDIISIDNWRVFTKKKNNNAWKEFREAEYSNLVTTLVNRAKKYNWSAWCGSTKNKFSITLYAFVNSKYKMSISIRLDGKSNAYKATFYDNHNPNNIPISNFDIYVGNTVNECEEFVWRRMEDFTQKYGNPIEEATYFTQKFLGEKEKYKFAREVVKSLDWYKE